MCAWWPRAEYYAEEEEGKGVDARVPWKRVIIGRGIGIPFFALYQTPLDMPYSTGDTLLRSTTMLRIIDWLIVRLTTNMTSAISNYKHIFR